MIHLDIKKLARFERVGHRITGDRRRTYDELDGAMSMCAWTKLRGSPASRSWAMNPAARPLASWHARCAGSASVGSRSSAYVRQRLSLGLRALCRSLTLAACAISAPGHAADQWQSRAFHPDAVARMGLRPSLSHLGSPQRRPRALARLVQSPPAPCLHCRRTTSQPGSLGRLNNLLGNDT